MKIKTLILYPVVFLAAFLLFQIEPIISKILLPKFGGSYLVWGACVVFFQALLLAGYFYSHFIVKKLGILRYRYFHLILLIAPLFLFPGRPLPVMGAHANIPMPIDVFGQLFVGIGLVFFVLSTTSIILQSWLAVSELEERRSPYFLYAASNLGSFAALLSYPFFFELFFDLDAQLLIWRICYFIFVCLQSVVVMVVKPSKNSAAIEGAGTGVGLKDKLRFFLLGAAGVIAFLSVTNVVTYEIAPIPLLWIIPLCIYLLSYVLVFKNNPWVPGWVKEKIHLVIGWSVLLFFLMQKGFFPVVFKFTLLFISLFIICMFCQSELSRHRPRHAGDLTIFYLIISLGGFFGGILVSWIIPLISVVMLEYLVAMVAVGLVLAIDEKQTRIGMFHMRVIIYLACLIIFWPLVFKNYNIFGLIVIIGMFKFIYNSLKDNARAFCASLVLILFLAPSLDPLWRDYAPIYRLRNYYGIYRVYDKPDEFERYLLHGSILHGAQSPLEKYRKQPLVYYSPLTPVGKVMTSDSFKFGRVGLVGLGTGTLAAYASSAQIFDFFEIDPEVYNIATKYFTYLKDSPAKFNFTIGDARISLGKIRGKRYDLLIIDAFSGDSIPVHLLTEEAILLYQSRLKEDGLILFHISNNYLELSRVLFSNAKNSQAYACRQENEDNLDYDTRASRWVALTWDKDTFGKLITKLKWSEFDTHDFRPWTDKYSNLVKIFTGRRLVKEIKKFQPFYW